MGNEYILVKRTELESLLHEIGAVKAIVAEEIRLSRQGASKPSAQASPSV